ncbi:FG-GAP repeat domain-containing protein [Lentibacillus sp. Marseille-P4043]|uniref:FG-GAP repeat domain-containing protein n=1 Tax=Lentibacillus sp. Marseille-P4043 TaxID=2040293 RepID=UPI000D0B6923|nr:VCBS repeat-containing protein [Lentibacillus sp. Marseille-P4043]
MKRITLLLLFLSLYFSLPVSAVTETNNQKTILIESYKEDVTGDGQKEEIQLSGILFSTDSGYFHNIWADIKGPQKKQWKINYEGGYKPSLQFKDLNHDGVRDLLFQSDSGGNSDFHFYQINTLKMEKLKKLSLPKSISISGSFQNGFKATLKLDPNKKPIKMDLQNRASEYIRSGIYDEQGKLLNEMKLMIEPISFFEPTFISKSKGYGLKSYQQVSGTSHIDQLGTIEILWYFEDNKWIKLKQKWRSESNN